MEKNDRFLIRLLSSLRRGEDVNLTCHTVGFIDINFSQGLVICLILHGELLRWSKYVTRMYIEVLLILEVYF